MKIKRIIRIFISFLITGVLLAVAFYKTSLSEVLMIIKTVNPCVVLLSTCFFGLGCVFRALMWHVTTRAFGKVSFSRLFGGLMVGYLANNFLPLRAGEVVRAGYLSTVTRIPIASSLSTIFIERAFDVLCLCLLLVIGIGVSGLEKPIKGKVWTLPGIVALSSLLFLAVIKMSKNIRKPHKLPKSVKSILNFIQQFIHPLEQLSNPQIVVLLSILSLAAWISNYLSVFILLNTKGESLYQEALLVLLFVNLGILIPSSPGSLGVMQMAFWLALAPFGFSKAESLALSFAYQGGLYFFTLVTGLPFLLIHPGKPENLQANHS